MVKTFQVKTFQRIWSVLESEVFPRDSNKTVFNQYKDINIKLDIPNANEIRKQNLRNYLGSFQKKPNILLVGEAAGPHGMRFSGIPFTSEAQLENKIFPFSGSRSSSKKKPHSENSGTVFWGALLSYYYSFFVWNLVPFHLHKAGDYLSIRNPTRPEIQEFSALLKLILEISKPQQVIAIGRTAQSALTLINKPCTYIRHPSQAGANAFRDGITKLFIK